MMQIVGGKNPSTVFREMLVDRPQLNNDDLASEFHRQFPETGLDAIQYIWKWQRPGRAAAGLDDEWLDQRLIHLLRRAGYLLND
jgi:hypothetical protein